MITADQAASGDHGGSGGNGGSGDHGGKGSDDHGGHGHGGHKHVDARPGDDCRGDEGQIILCSMIWATGKLTTIIARKETCWISPSMV